MEPLNSCDAVWDLLSLYADGEADPAERNRVENHVSTCETCARDLFFLRETTAVLSRTPLVAPPPDLRHAILAATVLRPTWRERFAAAATAALSPSRLRLAVAAGGFAILGLFIFKFGLQTVPVDPGTPRFTTGPTSRPNPEGRIAIRAGATAIRREGSEDRGRTGTIAVRTASRATAANPEGPTRPLRLSEPVQKSGAPRLTADTSGRHNFRVSPETRLVTASPMPVEGLALNEPSTMREPSAVIDPEVTRGPAVSSGSTAVAPAGPQAGPAPEPRQSYMLAASPGGGADSLVSFANLRSALRKGDLAARTVALDTSIIDRRAMMPLYKSQF